MFKKLFLGLLVGGLVLACSSGDDPATVADANEVNVDVGGPAGNNFAPAQLRIKVGQSVRWTWKGGSHNVVSGTCAGGSQKPDDKFRSGAPQQSGSFARKFDVAGTFPYYCEPHCEMGMTGEVIVE